MPDYTQQVVQELEAQVAAQSARLAADPHTRWIQDRDVRIERLEKQVQAEQHHNRLLLLAYSDMTFAVGRAIGALKAIESALHKGNEVSTDVASAAITLIGELHAQAHTRLLPLAKEIP